MPLTKLSCNTTAKAVPGTFGNDVGRLPLSRVPPEDAHTHALPPSPDEEPPRAHIPAPTSTLTPPAHLTRAPTPWSNPIKDNPARPSCTNRIPKEGGHNERCRKGGTLDQSRKMGAGKTKRRRSAASAGPGPERIRLREVGVLRLDDLRRGRAPPALIGPNVLRSRICIGVGAGISFSGAHISRQFTGAAVGGCVRPGDWRMPGAQALNYPHTQPRLAL